LNYDIDLNLVGPIDKFDLVLSSNPPLKDDQEILCLLTFRRPCKEVETTSKEIGAAEASALFAGEIENIITDKVEAITGIDRIQVDPYYSSTKAGSGPQITVSKRLLEDKLHVTYVTTLDPSQEQLIQMEYAMSDNISLVGQRDELGRAGADLKFHFEFR
jgi:translocation and assembly module TamB